MTIKVICAWCNKLYKVKEQPGPHKVIISHGVCSKCEEKIRKGELPERAKPKLI